MPKKKYQVWTSWPAWRKYVMMRRSSYHDVLYLKVTECVVFSGGQMGGKMDWWNNLRQTVIVEISYLCTMKRFYRNNTFLCFTQYAQFFYPFNISVETKMEGANNFHSFHPWLCTGVILAADQNWFCTVAVPTFLCAWLSSLQGHSQWESRHKPDL